MSKFYRDSDIEIKDDYKGLITFYDAVLMFELYDTKSSRSLFTIEKTDTIGLIQFVSSYLNRV